MESTSLIAKVVGPVLLLRGFSILLVAAVLIHVIAWGGILKASALILFPGIVIAKARALARAGFLNVVLVVCFLVGGYFTWFGYFVR